MTRDGNASDTKPKPKYEAPVVVPLGELALGHGPVCKDGAAASMNCNNGQSPGGRCGVGASK
jgi:hypothetical protein